jgi:hypothetical protein
MATMPTHDVMRPEAAPARDPAIGEPGCPDCGAVQLGRYCHLCGQPFGEGRLTLRRMGGWLLSRVTDVDRGFLLTLRRMTVAPGAMIREYVAGRRRRYLNPLSYLLIGVGLSLLIWNFLGDDLIVWGKEMFARSAESFPSLSAGQRRRVAELQIGVLLPYQAQIDVLRGVPFVLLMRLFFRTSGYNLAEHLVFVLFASAQVYYVHNVVMVGLIALRSPVGWHSLAIFLIYGGIFVQAALGFYGRGFATAAKTLVALALSFGLFSVASTTAFVAYVRLTTTP